MEPTPYETPIQSLVPSGVPLTNEIYFRSQDQNIPVLYEEPDRYAAQLAPSDYEVAVTQGTNQSSIDTYSSVENASQEAHNYTSPNGYTSLHPPDLDREQHIYTPPLQQSSSPQPQEHTYFTLDKGGGGRNEGGGGERGGAGKGEEGEGIVDQHCDTESLPQEHTYFMLENAEGGGGGRGDGEGRGVPSSNVGQKAQTQEHTYFTLEKTREESTKL